MAGGVIDLPTFLRDFGSKPFARGSADCGYLAGTWLETVRGVNPASAFVPPYADAREAARIIRKAGGLRHLGRRLADQAGLVEVEAPQAGDVGLVRIGRRTVFAICVGPDQWAVKTERGIAIAPMKHLVAWGAPRGSVGAEVIGALILSAFSVSATAGFTIGTATITYAAIVGSLALAAVSIGAQFALGRLTQQKNKDPRTGAAGQQEVREAISARLVHYGRVKVGGAVAYHDAAGGIYHRLLVTGHGEDDAIEEHWLGDKLVTVSGSAPFNVTDTAMAGWARIETRLGAATQTAFDALIAAYPTVWTSAHRLDGLSLALVSLIDPGRSFGNVFQGGVPAYRQVKRGRKVYDPRTGLTAWSDNPALIIAHHLMDPDQWAFPTTAIDWTSFAAFADLCDELVPLAGGGTEKRYRCWQSVSLLDPRKTSLGTLLKSCDGQVYTLPDNKIGIRGGKWEEPEFTVETHMIVSREWEFGVDPTETANEIKPIFRSPLHDYQDQEAAPWRDEDAIAIDGLISDTLDLQCVPSSAQAQRLAKIAALRINSPLRGTLRCNLGALPAYQQRIIRIIDETLAINSTFLVESFSFDISKDAMSVSMKVVEVDASHWSWNAGLEEGAAPPVPESTATTVTLPTVASFVPVVEIPPSAGVVQSVYLAATWSAPGGTEPLETEIESEALTTSVPGGTAQGSKLPIVRLETGVTVWRSEAVTANGQEYRVRARHTYAGRSPGEWTAWTTLTASASAAEPAAATGLSVTGGAGQLTANFTMPNDPTVFSAKVYWNTSNSMTGATLGGTAYGSANQALALIVTGVSAGTRWALVRTVSNAGVERTAAVSGSATVT